MQRWLVGMVVAAGLLCTPSMFAAGGAGVVPDAATLMQMEERAEHADAREQAYLYTELAHVYTEIAGRQIAAGDMDQATATLKHVNKFAALIHAGLDRNSKRLKNSELLMHETTYRLGEFVRTVSTEDKAMVQLTLKQMNKVNDEILAQVFAH